VQDVTQAIEFFKKNAAIYRIDTDFIIVAGNSVGAIIALQTAYSSNAKLRSLTSTIDSNLYSGPQNPNIAAVINFWGALFDPVGFNMQMFRS
jgi:predicted esterase